MIVSKCTGKICPMQVGYKVDECDYKDCTYRTEPITNADRIRGMNDEELAKHLVDIGLDCHFCAEHWRLDNEQLMRGKKCDGKCAEHCLEWLQQPEETE